MREEMREEREKLGRERESVCGRETYKEREIERDRKRERE
jgi:hypothetical protein